MASFKESVIIPYAMFKDCSFSKEVVDYNEPYAVRRQKELMQERMYNRKPYSVYSTDIPASVKRVIVDDNMEKRKRKINILDDVDDLPISEILKEIPVSQRPNIQSILDKLLENSAKWDRNGQLILRGKIIKGSNIVDIMNFFSRSTKSQKEPRGLAEIWDFLQRINVPVSWFRQKPFTRKESDSEDDFILGRYPLEDSQREEMLDTLNKSLGEDVIDESDKLDYAGIRGGPASDTEKHFDIGEIQEKLPESYKTFEESPQRISESETYMPQEFSTPFSSFSGIPKPAGDVFDSSKFRKSRSRVQKPREQRKSRQASPSPKDSPKSSQFGRAYTRTVKWDSWKQSSKKKSRKKKS